MATTTFTGTLKDPVGDPLGNAQLVFHAVLSSPSVTKGSSASAQTAADGTYSVTVEHGRYDILVRPERSRSHTRIVKNVTIDANLTATSLNDLAVEYADATPDILLEIRALSQGARDNKADAEQAVTDAGDIHQQVVISQAEVDEMYQYHLVNTASMSSMENRMRLEGQAYIESSAANALAAETAEQRVRLMIEEFNA